MGALTFSNGLYSFVHWQLCATYSRDPRKRNHLLKCLKIIKVSYFSDIQEKLNPFTCRTYKFVGIHWIEYSQSTIKGKRTKKVTKVCPKFSCFIEQFISSIALLRALYSIDHHEIIGSASEYIKLSHGCLKIEVPSFLFKELRPFKKWFIVFWNIIKYGARRIKGNRMNINN
jgi:hypothetical protein